MTQKVSRELLNDFSEFVSEKLGLTFSDKGSLVHLEAALDPISKAFGFQNISDCLNWLINIPLTRKQIEILARFLTIGETSFFRDQKMFNLFKEDVLPKIIEERKSGERRIRIWSAGCCTGEEPYSVAITLKELLPDLATWNITILGTDINEHFLKQARQGVFSSWSLRNVSHEILQKYFKKSGKQYVLDSSIMGMVNFSYLNLVEDVYPAIINETNAMDIILCNNVLIYFSQNQIKKTIHQLSNCLVDNGFFFVSSVEVPYVAESSLQPHKSGGITYFKKDHTKEQNHFISQKVTIASSPFEACQQLYKLGLYYNVSENLEQFLLPFKHDPLNLKLYSHELILLIHAFANQGLLDKSYEWCQSGLNANPFDPQLHHIFGLIQHEKGDLEGAISSLKMAVFFDPHFIMAQFNLGLLLWGKQQKQQANHYLKNAYNLVTHLSPNTVLPYSDGLTVSRLSEYIGDLLRE